MPNFKSKHFYVLGLQETAKSKPYQILWETVLCMISDGTDCCVLIKERMQKNGESRKTFLRSAAEWVTKYKRTGEVIRV
jgi:hypothetical protein